MRRLYDDPNLAFKRPDIKVMIMAVLCFRLRNVSVEEADEVRQLLDRHGLEHYETSAGRWGIGLPAIWLRHDDELPRARQLIDAYQAERAARVKAEYAERVASGEQQTLFGLWAQQPLRVVVYLAVIAVIVYFSTRPFFSLLA